MCVHTPHKPSFISESQTAGGGAEQLSRPQHTACRLLKNYFDL